MQDAEAGDGGEEEDGAAGAGGDHVAGAGLGDEEGAGEVGVEEVAEEGRVVGFRFYVGAFLFVYLVSVGEFIGDVHDREMDGWMDGWIT